MSDAPHIPVMLEEVCEHMSLRDGGVYVDGTFGAGGYTRAMLDRADCRVIALIATKRPLRLRKIGLENTAIA